MSAVASNFSALWTSVMCRFHAVSTQSFAASPRPSSGTPDAAENSDGLALPATASPRELLMLAGAFLMLLGFLWLLMNRERRLW